MKKRWLCWLLAVALLCALVGCGKDTDTKPKDNNKTTTTTTTTTVAAPEQEVAPIELVEGEVDPSSLCYHFVDEDAVEHNEELVLKANVDLTNVQVLSLNSAPPTVGNVLFSHPLHYTGQYWCIHTYINDTIPTRGVACTDKEGKTYYYAITYSGKDGSVNLTPLEITALSEERLTEIEAYLNTAENNGFVSMNEYTCPEEVSLFNTLYDGAGIGVGSWEWTDEEVQDYIVAAEWEELYTSVLRFKRADVEALLQKKLGISIADLTKDIDMLYIEKYDAYYHAHSDVQYQPVEVLSGWLEGGEGGLFVVDYKIGWGDGKGRVVLKLTKDGYQFVSNAEIDLTELSEERLTEIETYLNAEENNGFVSMNEYTCPEEVSLHDALYNIGVPHWDWTEEETEAYLNATGQTDRETAFLMPVFRHDRAETEALMQKKLGISITLTVDNMKMSYIEGLDAFFTSHTDSQYQAVEVLSGYIEGGEGGLYVVSYKLAWGKIGQVTLRLTKDGYQFVSNRYTAE